MAALPKVTEQQEIDAKWAEFLGIVKGIVQSGGDDVEPNEQCEEAMLEIKKRSVLYSTLRSRFFREAVLEAVYDARHRFNTKLKYAVLAAPLPKARLTMAAELAQTAWEGTIFSFQLSCGKRLGEGTGSDLLLQANVERKTAEGKMRVARFFEALSDKVGCRRVCDVLTIAAVEKMKREYWVAKRKGE